MASVINSARTSTASVFDLVGNMANVGSQLVSNAALATDALTSKTRVMHASVLNSETISKTLDRTQAIEDAASDAADRLESLHRRRFPNQPFDWNQAYENYHAQLTAAFASLSN